MNDVIVRSRPIGPVVMAAINAGLVGINGWLWVQGSPSSWVRALTIVPGILLFFNVLSIFRPVELRVAGGRLTVRPGWAAAFSTPRENVSRCEFVADQIFLRFADLAQVQAGPMMRKMFEVNQAGGGSHIVLPLRAETASIEALKAALGALPPAV